MSVIQHLIIALNESDFCAKNATLRRQEIDKHNFGLYAMRGLSLISHLDLHNKLLSDVSQAGLLTPKDRKADWQLKMRERLFWSWQMWVKSLKSMFHKIVNGLRHTVKSEWHQMSQGESLQMILLPHGVSIYKQNNLHPHNA